MNWFPHPHLNSAYNPILVYGWSASPSDSKCSAWLHVQGLRNQGMYTLKFFELPEPGPYHEIWGRGFRQESRVWRSQNWDLTDASEIQKILEWATDQFSPMTLLTEQIR